MGPLEYLSSAWLKICMLAVLIAGAFGSAADDEAEAESISVLHLVVAGVFFACVIAILALCVRVEHNEPLPSWVATIQPDPNLVNEGFRECSDGAMILSPQIVQNKRSGNLITDGARWSVPFSRGKHVFEIHWPRPVRGYFACIGVGTAEAPLHTRPRDSLVGCNKHTWGLEITVRKIKHNGRLVCRFPTWMQWIPDTFSMYLDCDNHTVGFGADDNYWGNPITIPAARFPVYVMIGILKEGSQMSLTYKGSATT